MKPLIFISTFLLSFHSKAQQTIGPYNLGTDVEDTVFTFTYVAGDGCPLPYNAHINFDGLFPFVSGLNINLHALSPATVNSTFLPTGSTFPILPNSSPLEVSFYNTWNFALIASGTPTIANEQMPCWFEDLHNATCNSDSASFQWGESLVPCYVGPSVGIFESFENPLELKILDGMIELNSRTGGILSVTDMTGRILMSKSIKAGVIKIELPVAVGAFVVQLEYEQKIYSHKIALH